MPGWEYFPPRCCPPQENMRGINIGLCKDVLKANGFRQDQVFAYQKKGLEYCIKVRTPELHVTCAKCCIWLHPCRIGYEGLSKVANCPLCHADTCMGCKNQWEGFQHRCDGFEDISAKPPEWMPDYAPDCRIKPCPRCHIWIQLFEACNHMTCEHCYFQFCFVCMAGWEGDHQGCPVYGDLTGGYDAEGYQKQGRKLHVYTGLDRLGLSRLDPLLPSFDESHVEEPVQTPYDQVHADEYFDAQDGGIPIGHYQPPGDIAPGPNEEPLPFEDIAAGEGYANWDQLRWN